MNPISIPQIKYTCHNELICDINKNALPASRPLTVTKSRGPYLSLNLPARIPRPPPTSIVMDCASDRAPLSQPNSMDTGLKNTPGVYIIMVCAAREKILRITMTQP